MPRALFAALKKVLTGAIARRDRLAVLSAAQSVPALAARLARAMGCLAFLIGAIVTVIIAIIIPIDRGSFRKQKRSRKVRLRFFIVVDLEAQVRAATAARG